MARGVNWCLVETGAAHEIEQQGIHAEKGSSSLVARIWHFDGEYYVYKIFWLVVNFEWWVFDWLGISFELGEAMVSKCFLAGC